MCEFFKQEKKCCKNNIYGNYCFTHRKNYLTKNDIILYDRFTNNIKDYLKNDIIKTLEYYNLSEYIKNKNKDYYYNILKNHINSLLKYNDKIEGIKLIQKNIRKFNDNKNTRIRGPGFLNRDICTNDEDFFTYESKYGIEDKYFFSYKDEKFIWCFDVRSLKKLLDMNMSNPYTRESIPNNIKINVDEIIKNLKDKKICFSHDADIIKERTQTIKQKTVDIFARLEQCGYYCNMEWFTLLSLNALKKLYRSLEDIWNYRTQLPHDVKCNMVPPNGILFNVPINNILSMTSKTELQDLILSDIKKFDNAITSQDKQLGYIYFLYGLCEVSRDCYLTYYWLIQ